MAVKCFQRRWQICTCSHLCGDNINITKLTNERWPIFQKEQYHTFHQCTSAPSLTMNRLASQDSWQSWKASQEFLPEDSLSKIYWGRGCGIGMKQLQSTKVQVRRKIASLRIHVQRAKGRIQNFNILTGALPISMARLSSKSLNLWLPVELTTCSCTSTCSSLWQRCGGILSVTRGFKRWIHWRQ